MSEVCKWCDLIAADAKSFPSPEHGDNWPLCQGHWNCWVSIKLGDPDRLPYVSAHLITGTRPQENS